MQIGRTGLFRGCKVEGRVFFSDILHFVQSKDNFTILVHSVFQVFLTIRNLRCHFWQWISSMLILLNHYTSL